VLDSKDKFVCFGYGTLTRLIVTGNGDRSLDCAIALGFAFHGSDRVHRYC